MKKPSETVVKYINQLAKVSPLLKDQIIKINKELNKDFISREEHKKEIEELQKKFW